MIKDIEYSPVPVLITTVRRFMKYSRRPIRIPPQGAFVSIEVKQREFFKNNDLPDTFIWVDIDRPIVLKQVVLWHEIQHALCYTHNCSCNIKQLSQKIPLPQNEIHIPELHAYYETLRIILKKQLLEYLVFFMEHAQDLLLDQFVHSPYKVQGKACLVLEQMDIFTIAKHIVNTRSFENQLLFYNPLAKIPVFAAKK